ncbi:indigoidine synthase A-like protein [Dichomitus squalens]|uniref:indigoidine synthase A-like protein n=1 Tax=Dichomitus squalens (strain LYAD-421) TaxID=732165 RepID=UPI0004412DBC|nr:indigoidine synthase A-like protein [Dichomitus squalens LYAD-421 SS1]EJF66774.1 indigoidine synthase A-like protein [Dichomitus squalens LYAD-421 SS1]TBU45108.1 indigoidine synthase A-like protein [Dichomitus squalens]
MSFLQRRAAPLLRPTTASLRCKRPISLSVALKEHAPIDVHPEVQEALAHRRPVVALETTIVTHGMPYPTNRETALSVESNVRKAGAIPATIGLIEGRVKIGLEPLELERLADVSKNPSVVKLSRRDLGTAIALKKDGGTTCSTTLIFAALAGIKVFSTGGLGGVHRGAESTMDISADLHELTRCPVGLVSAGVKSILDIGRTLEYLETLGVPVVSYGPTDDFPAFYTRRSGFKSPWRIDDPESAARILNTHRQLGMSNGALFAVPIPEEYESVGEELQRAVEQAIKESEANGVSRRGKEATPWLLKRVSELTAGKSLNSNIALIENTATIGGQIAVAYSQLARETSASHPHVVHPESTPAASKPERTNVPPAKLVIVGSAAVDVTARADPVPGGARSNNNLYTTSPGVVSLTSGGVGRNVAEAAYRILSSFSKDLAHSAVLVSPIGEDAFGQLLVSESERIGMRTDGLIRVPDARTAVCNMVLDSAGELTGGVADMDVIRTLDAAKVIEVLDKQKPSLLALDANMSPETMKSLLTYATKRNISTFFEPTSVPKSTTIFPAIAASLSSASLSHAPVTFATPNVLELAHMYQEACASPLELTAHKYWWQVIDDMTLGSEFRMELEQLARRQAFEDEAVTGNLSFLVENGIAQMTINLLPFFQHLIIKCGERGLIAAFRISGEQAQSSAWANQSSNVYARQVVAHNRTGSHIVVFKHFPPIRVAAEKIVNVTGAGDSLVGSMLATLSQAPNAFESPEALDQLVAQAQLAAVYTLQSEHAVSPRLSNLGTNGRLH